MKITLKLPKGYDELRLIAEYNMESEIENHKEYLSELLPDNCIINEDFYYTLTSHLNQRELINEHIERLVKASTESINDNLSRNGITALTVDVIDEYKCEYIISDLDVLVIELQLHGVEFCIDTLNDVVTTVFKGAGVYDDTIWELHEVDSISIDVRPLKVVYEEDTSYFTGKLTKHYTLIVDSDTCVEYNGHSSYCKEWLAQTKPVCIDDVDALEFVDTMSRLYDTFIFIGVDSEGNEVILNKELR